MKISRHLFLIVVTLGVWASQAQAATFWQDNFIGTPGNQPVNWWDETQEVSFDAHIAYSYTTSWAAITRTTESNWGRVLSPVQTVNVAQYPMVEIVVTGVSAGTCWRLGIQEQEGSYRLWVLASNLGTGTHQFDYAAATGWGTGTHVFSVKIIVEGTGGTYIEVDSVRICGLSTPTPTPVPPLVSSLAPRYSLANTQINLFAKGKDFDGISAIQLKNSSQTVISSSMDVVSNSLTAWFSLPAEAGLFDLVLSKGTADSVFKTVFTLHLPLSGPVQWQVNDLGKAGNPPAPSPSGIVIGDADRDGQAEMYVVNNDRMIFCYKKNPDWTISYLLETPGENFQQLLIADGNRDGDWELYVAGTKPQTYQCLWTGDWQSNTVCPYGGLLAWGDGNHDGVNELYAISGNITTGQGIVQCSYNGSVWTSSVVESEQSIYNFTSLLVGDADNDQADEVYAANQDHYLYQFKYNGSSWQRSIVLTVGNGKTKSLVLGDLDRDRKNELYAANEDGKIYQLKWTGSAWVCLSINTNSVICNQIAVSDGDNDGQDEIYGAGEDGHAYQFRLNGSAWQMIDLGNTGTPLLALAVGDGDNNFQFEVYAVGENAHVYQFQATGNDLTPTPTITPIPIAPDKFLKIYQSQINPNRGEEACITWCQPHSGLVTITIYNMLGEKVATLADHREYPSGQYNEVVWKGITQNGRVAGSGIYVVHIKAGAYQDKAKICVVK